jgi:hypothetical protein
LRSCAGQGDFSAVTAFLRFNGARRRQPQIDGWFDSQPAELADIAREWFSQGAGRFMRHVKARPGALPDRAPLEALIRAAYAEIKNKLDAEKDLKSNFSPERTRGW